MKQEIINKLNRDVILTVVRHFGCNPDSLAQLDGFENILYEAERTGGKAVLRITHESHRNENLLKGELEWINYLADKGVSTPRTIPSQNGKIIETINTGDSRFYASCFEKAPGIHMYSLELKEDLIAGWGQLTGIMHALARNFRPSHPEIARYHWDGEDDVVNAEKYLPSEQMKVLYKFEELIDNLRKLPQDTDSYGFIHGDLNPSNILVDDDRLFVIDFDDSRYEWFISEIASILFYPVIDELDCQKRKAMAEDFMKHFMSGYQLENEIEKPLLQHFPQFLKLREIGQYVSIYRSCDLDNLNKWCRMFMQGRKEMIENDVPVVDIDFTTFKG